MTTTTIAPKPLELADLLAEAGWVRRLARSLVSGDSAAEDLVQDTWSSTLEHPPRPGREVRPWLARVLRNRFLTSKRGERRRQAREAAVMADTEAHADAGTPEELVLRMEVHRLLADLVMALDEPFRQTVLLRSYEGLSGAEIARRLKVPEGTVRWRLKTALDRLRASLEQREEGRSKPWRALLLPLTHRKSELSVTPTVRSVATGTRLTWKPIGAVALATVMAAVAMSYIVRRHAHRAGRIDARAQVSAPASNQPSSAQQRLRQAIGALSPTGRPLPAFKPAPRQRPSGALNRFLLLKDTGVRLEALFDEEKRDPVWAPRMEAHLRGRLSQQALGRLGLAELDLRILSLACLESGCRIELDWSTEFVQRAHRSGLFKLNPSPINFINNTAGPLAASPYSIGREWGERRTRETFLFLFHDDLREPEDVEEWLSRWPETKKQWAARRATE